MVAGGLTTIIWEASGMSASINAIIVSLPVAVVIFVVISLLTKKKSALTEAEKAERPSRA